MNTTSEAVKLAVKLTGNISPWTMKPWTKRDRDYLAADLRLWLQGVRDHRISDFCAVNANALYFPL